MRNKFSKIVLIVAFGLVSCFAQDKPEKLAVYVSGASDAGVNKSLSNKLLVAMVQNGKYAEITDPMVFQNELANSGKDNITFIVQTAKRYEADYVCIVNIIEAFGTYSVTARVVKTSDSQVIKTGSADRSLKSMDDLTAVSDELTRQFLSLGNQAIQPPLHTAVTVTSITDITTTSKQCARKYNINELLFKIKNSFPTQLNNCSSTLSKDMLTPASFGGKKLEPKSFMMQCPVDGIKKELPEGFPNTDKIIGSLTNFVQGIMNSAIAGGTLDPKKLVSAVASTSTNIGKLMSDVKELANDECVVDEPYVPPASTAPIKANDSEAVEDKQENKELSTGASIGVAIGLVSIFVLFIVIMVAN